MYEAVHAHPDGESTVARFTATAADYGYDGLVVRNHDDGRVDFDADELRSTYGIDVVSGVEVRADGPEQASGYLGNFRPDYEILAIHGDSTRLNRFAVEQPRVDVLAHPTATGGTFDHVMAKEAVENDVCVEVNLSRVLRSDGGPRVQAIRDLRAVRKLLVKFDVPFVVSADATSHLELRAPRELFAVGETIGFSEAEIRDGLAAWRRLTERNRERLSDSFVEPGVRLGRHEDQQETHRENPEHDPT